ncbi:MAG: hypothetical protein ACKV19_14265 [Verrucomicrobiales bacterium]
MKTLLLSGVLLLFSLPARAVIIDWVIFYDAYDINVPERFYGEMFITGSFEADELPSGLIENPRNATASAGDSYGSAEEFSVNSDILIDPNSPPYIFYWLRFPDGGINNRPRSYQVQAFGEARVWDAETGDGVFGPITSWRVDRRNVSEPIAFWPVILSTCLIVAVRRYGWQRST